MICSRNIRKRLKAIMFKLLCKIPFIDEKRVILESGYFDASFACPSWYHVANPLEWYLNKFKNGGDCRKPMPGFHPGIYAEYINTRGVNPFVHFLKRGQPKGPWLSKVISQDNEIHGKNELSATKQCALHIHLHYYEKAQDLLKTLSQNLACLDLKISVTSTQGRDSVLRVLEKMGSYEADVRIVPNRGRDIGPFLTEFGRDLRKYKLLGHIHAKASALVDDRLLVDRWVNFLTENLVGGRIPMTDVILSHFDRNPLLGLVFADDPNIIGWTHNKLEAETFAARMQLPLPLPSSINFPVGTMFWARPEALAPLFDLNLKWEDYPEEPVAYDGTILHAIERLFPLITRRAGYECAVTHIPGVSR